MCRFKSGVILKNRIVIAEGENDSHSDLLESIGIEDNYIGATRTFVRAELIPKNDEWWVSPEEHPERWDFVVDQDIIPEWFDREQHEKEFGESVCAWWEKHVLVDQKIKKLDSGYYRLKRCEVETLFRGAKVLLDGSTVRMMYGNSTVRMMHGSSTVQKMYGSSTVQEMYGNSTVQEMRGSSTVQKMYGSSTVQKMYGGSIAIDFKNYPKIKIIVQDPNKFKLVKIGTENNQEAEP